LNSCQDFANAPIHTGEDIGSLLGENYREVLKILVVCLEKIIVRF
jgi:hypothetical protein